jgi:hypothetical protein
VNIKQQSHLKMLVVVLGVLDKFKTIWQAVAAFATARNDLSAAIDAVNAQELKQAGLTTGITQNKRLARQALCNAAALVGGAVAAWADKQNNHELFNTVDFSAPDLLHQTEQACATNCKAILDAGTASLAALAPGQTLAQTDLDDLTAKIGAFKTLLTKPREAKAITKGATDLIPDKLDAGDRILERQIDRLMERYKGSNPDFYGAYQVARVIVDAGGGPGTLPTPPTPPATPAK